MTYWSSSALSCLKILCLKWYFSIHRIVSEFEERARSVIEHVAEIKYALFPIQCFSLNEGPKYSINFHHHVKLESPGIVIYFA